MVNKGSVIGNNNSTTFYNYITRSRTGSKTGNTEKTSYCSNYVNKNLKKKFNQIFIHNIKINDLHNNQHQSISNKQTKEKHESREGS